MTPEYEAQQQAERDYEALQLAERDYEVALERLR